MEERIKKVLDYLTEKGIEHTWYTHEEAPTIEIARTQWRADG